MSPEWRDFYDARNVKAGVGRYSELEKLVDIFVTEAPRMLEIGVGAGGEIPYFTGTKGFGYHGIDGSQSAINRLRARFEALPLACGDFSESLCFEGPFDFIVDRASISHNRLHKIKACVGLVYEALAPGGIFITSDWFSSKHSEALRGEEVEPNTRGEYEDGQFSGIGEVHFSSEAEIVELFRGFDGLYMQERIVRRTGPNALMRAVPDFRWIGNGYHSKEYRSAVWDVVVRKPT